MKKLICGLLVSIPLVAAAQLSDETGRQAFLEVRARLSKVEDILRSVDFDVSKLRASHQSRDEVEHTLSGGDQEARQAVVQLRQRLVVLEKSVGLNVAPFIVRARGDFPTRDAELRRAIDGLTKKVSSAETQLAASLRTLAERVNAADRVNAEQSRFAASLNSAATRNLPWRERLDRVVQAELRQWLAADASGLEEIPPPAYPAALSLKQEVWETNKEFEDRVEAARAERRRTIERLEADYRAKVDQRNKRVAEYNKTRQEREAGLAKRREELITAGLAILAPAATMSDVAFDQQLGVLTISAQIDGLGRQVFAFKDAPQAFRRSALTEAGALKANPEFQVSQTGEISLQALSVQAGGTSARGTPSTGIASPVQLASVTIPAQSPALAQQGAVTVDRNQVEQILYRDENEMLRKRLEDQRRQQEAALAAAETRAAQEIARIRAEAQRAGAEVVRAPQAQVQEAHALVIGNSDYRGSARLENPTRDAQAMSAKLRALGFRVTELSNTNREQMVRGLSEFTRTALKADLTLLFYAGHGMQVQGVNYMIPVDMSLNDPSQATLQAVSLTQVVEQYLPGKTKLVFLDACRDNPIVAAGVRGASKGLAPINASEGTLIAYATKDGQTAEDGVGAKNSPFTQALLAHLADPFDIGVVLRRVREKVMQATGGKQQPWEYGSLTGGELVLSRIGVKKP